MSKSSRTRSETLGEESSPRKTKILMGRAMLALGPKRKNKKLELLCQLAAAHQTNFHFPCRAHLPEAGCLKIFISMVRTRNNRGGGEEAGGGSSNKESSSSLKPASLSSRLATGAAAKKKGRKRQLGEGSSREEEEMGLVDDQFCTWTNLNSCFQELTHSAALSPVAGPSSGTSTAQRGESRAAVAPESHDRSSVPPGGQDQSMEQQGGNHVWGHVAHQRQDPAEQGYLAPPINYNNNNYPDEQEEQALSEPCSSASGGQGSAIESHHGEEGGQEVGIFSFH